MVAKAVRNLSLEVRGFGDGSWRVVEAQTLSHSDRKATNTKDAPEELSPRPNGDTRVRETGDFAATLPAASWNLVVLQSETA